MKKKKKKKKPNIDSRDTCHVNYPQPPGWGPVQCHASFDPGP